MRTVTLCTVKTILLLNSAHQLKVVESWPTKCVCSSARPCGLAYERGCLVAGASVAMRVGSPHGLEAQAGTVGDYELSLSLARSTMRTAHLDAGGASGPFPIHLQTIIWLAFKSSRHVCNISIPLQTQPLSQACMLTCKMMLQQDMQSNPIDRFEDE